MVVWYLLTVRPVCVTVPSAPPRKVEVESVNSTAIRVSWKLPISNKQHGQIRGYQVTYVKLENNEPRGQPVIKDVMLSEAQVQWGPRADGHGTLPLCRGPGWLDPSFSWPPFVAPEHGTRPFLSKANSLSLNCGLQMGKKFNQERIAVGKMKHWIMLVSYTFSNMYTSLPATSCADSSWSRLCFASQVINCHIQISLESASFMLLCSV